MSRIYQNFYDLNEHKRLFYVAAEEIAKLMLEKFIEKGHRRNY